MSADYEYPTYFMNEENIDARAFIDVLLNKIPEARLQGGFQGLKGHKWYEDFDWNSLADGS